MVLNYIWLGLLLVGIAVGLGDFAFTGDPEALGRMVDSTFENAETGFRIALGLTGVMALWLGLMKIGEEAGLIAFFSRVVSPFFTKLFPEIPKNHPVTGNILMNFSANLLGLDNAATPLGLKAMQELEKLNPNPGTASNAEIMFLVLNTSGLTLVPVSVMVFRAEQGVSDPSDVFLPILMATACSTVAGVVITSFFQRVRILHPIMLAALLTVALLIASLFAAVLYFSREVVEEWTTTISHLIILAIITAFLVAGLWKRFDAYSTFVEGAKEGFQVAIKIIPYLVAMLVAIGVFRASGAMEFVLEGMAFLVGLTGADTEFVKALPTAMMKPLSGSGARGMMVEAMDNYGAETLVGRMVSVMQGSTDTTFYVLAVYFGSVNISRTRHAALVGIAADLAGIIAAIVITYWFPWPESGA